MRIALVHPYCWPEVRRGAERYLDDLSAFLSGRGHDVHVITGTSGARRIERGADGVRIDARHHVLAHRATRFGIGATETFGALALLPLLGGGSEVVHAFTPTGAIAGRLAGKPTLFSLLGHPHGDQLPAQRAPRRLLRSAVRVATATAALSAASARVAERTLGCRAVVLAPGIRLERFSPDLAPRRGPVRLLFSASLDDRRKRADLAVAAFTIVLERHPDARLALSGTGDPSWALAGTPVRVRRAVDVLGPGRLDDVPVRYRAATVTILPAEHEAFGLALVESLACGTPAVCLPSGGAPGVLVAEGGDGEANVGAVASACTPTALAEAVERAVALAADPATPGRCRARAGRWSWEREVGPAHERMYAALGPRGQGPRAHSGLQRVRRGGRDRARRGGGRSARRGGTVGRG